MIAAILAKRSERFPGKHMTEVNGRTLIGRVVRTLVGSSLFEEVIIFTKDPDVWDEGATVIPDKSEGTSIDSILSLVNTYGEVFVFAGDMPFIDVRIVSDILEMYDGKPVFPLNNDGFIEPLHGIYNSTMIESMIATSGSGDKSLKSAIRRCDISYYELSRKQEDSFFNINRREDLERLH